MFNIDINVINESSITNNGSFLQTPFWCEFKSRHGWSYKRFKITYILPAEKSEENCRHNAPLQDLKKTFELAVLNRSFAKGMFSIAYIPLMPELPFKCTSSEKLDAMFDDDENKSIAVSQDDIITPETQTIEFAALLSELGKALRPFLPSNTIAIRYDPEVVFDTPEDRDLFNYGMKTVSYADRLKISKSKVDIQPPDSTLIDLTLEEDKILEKMHQKWRYNIRLSERKGVSIHKYSGSSPEIEDKIDVFYALTKETNARDGNSSHAKSYYLDLIKSSAKEISEGKDVPEISLYIAENEGEEIASIMTLFSRDEAIYLYGASSNKKRNLMPNHLLQWTAIRDAKSYGSKIYDMYGMPPEGKNENHPMHGLYMFKANFGGRIIHRCGSWDLQLNPVFVIYRIAEKLRSFWFKKVIKKIKGR